jgi:hypothetical protein
MVDSLADIGRAPDGASRSKLEELYESLHLEMI